jgi:hypothetical protein
MQTILKALAAVAALCIAWRVGDISSSPQRRPPAPVHEARMGPRNERKQGEGRFNGLAVQLHGGTDVYEKFHSLVPEIAALGADTIEFVVHGWQQHAGSLDLHIDARKTADAKALGQLCDLATGHGLRIILMPVVLLESPRNNEWRGKIIPAGHDWDGWFKRYNTFIQHFAAIAERHKVAVLMVGSELIKTEVYADRWKRIIEEVRQNYRGKIGYSANWDHYQTSKIGFWDKLDYVGMTTYYELAKAANPSQEEVDANWARIKAEILKFQKEVRKPIIFTEVGWCSQEGAAHEGWNYYANQKATEEGRREQTMLYESFIKTWADQPEIGGIIWWEWDTTVGGESDFNYTPRGKPVEQTIRRLFAREREASLSAGMGQNVAPSANP